MIEFIFGFIVGSVFFRKRCKHYYEECEPQLQSSRCLGFRDYYCKYCGDHILRK